jgi:5,10-methylenetetrahydromethanopterin reductase
MEMAALDELAQGRAMLGIGSGIPTAVERMGLSYAKPLAAVRDGIHIVRGMLAGETVHYEGAAFAAKGVKLEFPAPRPNMPIYMAAMGEQALRLAGQVADGLMISNMCPPGFTERAIRLMAQGAAKAGRKPPREIIQYVPCCVRADPYEARRLVKGAIGGMLSAYWRMGERWPAVRQAMTLESGIPETDIVSAIDQIGRGEAAHAVLDDRFVQVFAVAGTPEDILQSARQIAASGVTELVFTMVGPQPAADLAMLGTVLGGAVRHEGRPS